MVSLANNTYIYRILLTFTTESYLKERQNATFDRDDFDCLSNKFLSKLVIRAN